MDSSWNSWLFRHRFSHRFFHRFLMENGSKMGCLDSRTQGLFGSLFTTFSEDRFFNAFWSPVGSFWAPFWFSLASFSRPFPKINFLMHFCRPLAHFWLLFASCWLLFGRLWLSFGSFFLRRCRGSLPVSRFLSPWGRGVHAVVFIHFFYDIFCLLQMSNAYLL